MEKSFGGSFELSYSFAIRVYCLLHGENSKRTPICRLSHLSRLRLVFKKMALLLQNTKTIFIEILRPKTKLENFLGN